MKKEPPPQLLLDWKDSRQAITSLEQELMEREGGQQGEEGGSGSSSSGRRLVLAATPGALYMAVGGPGLAGTFSR